MLLLSVRVTSRCQEEPRECEKFNIAARRYLTSTTLEELAGTACADVSVQILVSIANVDPWAQGGSPVRWVQLDDMTTSLSEIDRSFRGFNTVKFVEVCEQPQVLTPDVSPPATASKPPSRSVHEVLGVGN